MPSSKLQFKQAKNTLHIWKTPCQPLLDTHTWLLTLNTSVKCWLTNSVNLLTGTKETSANQNAAYRFYYLLAWRWTLVKLGNMAVTNGQKMSFFSNLKRILSTTICKLNEHCPSGMYAKVMLTWVMIGCIIFIKSRSSRSNDSVEHNIKWKRN